MLFIWIDKIVTFILYSLIISITIFDMRESRVPNFLVFPSILVGLVLHLFSSGVVGGLFALKGVLVGFGLLLIPYLVKGMKAGDVKFSMAIGALLGPIGIIRVILITLIFYPILAFIVVVHKQKLKVTVLRFFKILFYFLGVLIPSLKLYAMRLEGFDDNRIASATTPFGVAIAIGTLISIHTNLLKSLF